MSAFKTIQLSIHTRDEPKKLAEERGISADEAVTVAIAALRWEELRQQAELEARHLGMDPSYRREAADAVRDLTGEVA